LQHATLRRAALWLCLASLIFAAPLGGRAGAADPAPAGHSAPAASPFRKITSLLRFIDEPPRIRLQAQPPHEAHPRRNFERFPANVALFRLLNGHRAPWLDMLALVLLVLGSGWGLLPAVAYAALPKTRPRRYIQRTWRISPPTPERKNSPASPTRRGAPDDRGRTVSSVRLVISEGIVAR